MDSRERRSRGLAFYAEQLGLNEVEVEAQFVARYGREFAEEAFSSSGGAAWHGPSLSQNVRSLLVIAILSTQGGVEPRLRGHINWALENGVTEDEIRSVMTLLANYAGFPRASMALEVLNAELAANPKM
jgi:4-carboxymuconolactone decarboxylase